MIIKILSRPLSQPRLYQLTKYILQGKEQFDGSYFTILQNTTATTAKGIAAAFRRNNQYVTKRKNSRGIEHVIFSFHPEEKHILNDAILLDLGRKFLELRGALDAVVFAQPHYETNNIHLHFMISVSQYKRSKSMRLSKFALKELQQNMNLYQQETYPQLKHSLPYLSPKNKAQRLMQQNQIRQANGDAHIHKRGQRSQKEQLRLLLLELGKNSQDQKTFFDAIAQAKEVELYTYRNKIQGVIHKQKKYRFKTLGLDTSNIGRQYQLLQHKGDLQRNNQNERESHIREKERHHPLISS